MNNINIPKEVKVFNDQQNFLIAYRWFTYRAPVRTVFVIIWDYFFVYKLHYSETPLIFLLPYIFIGIWITYANIATYINKTYVKINQSSLSIRHAPIPWLGNKTLNTRDIEKVYSEMTLIGGKSPQLLYSVCIVLKNKDNIKLISRMVHDAAAVFITQEIKRYLGLDPKVPNEV